MKKVQRAMMAVIFATGIATLGVACGKNSTEAEASKQYTCSMHADVLQTGPGKCPKCGMALNPK